MQEIESESNLEEKALLQKDLAWRFYFKNNLDSAHQYFWLSAQTLRETKHYLPVCIGLSLISLIKDQPEIAIQFVAELEKLRQDSVGIDPWPSTKILRYLVSRQQKLAQFMSELWPPTALPTIEYTSDRSNQIAILEEHLCNIFLSKENIENSVLCLSEFLGNNYMAMDDLLLYRPVFNLPEIGTNIDFIQVMQKKYPLWPDAD